MQSFKGVKIDSVNPLVIETWSDAYTADAELDLSTWWPSEPTYGYGEAGWDIISVANLAEQLVKSLTQPIRPQPRVSTRPTLSAATHSPFCPKYLGQAASQKYIPYAPTLGAYITADDAATRYAICRPGIKLTITSGLALVHIIWIQSPRSKKSLVLKSYSGYADLSVVGLPNFGPHGRNC